MTLANFFDTGHGPLGSAAPHHCRPGAMHALADLNVARHLVEP